MILLIEDNPDDMLLLRQMLEGLDKGPHDICEASRLVDGLVTLRNRQPELVLLDLNLPDARGLEGLTQVQRLVPEVPIVVVTGDGDETAAVAALRAGAEDYLRKDHLEAATLERVLGRSVARHERLSRVGRALREQRHLATHDELTGLPNRTLLLDRLAHAIERATRDRSHLALIYLDLDGFKVINDTLGHAAGDELLVHFAATVADALRAMDTVARLGGDEFVVLLEAPPNRRTVQSLIDKLRALFPTALPLRGHPCAVDFSAGTAFYPEDGPDARRLLEHADQMMYHDKRARRHRHLQAGMQALHVRRNIWE